MLKRNSVCIFYGRIHAFISGRSAGKCFGFCFSWLNSNTVWFMENGNDLWKSTLSSPSKCNREWVSFFCPWATEMWIEAPVVLLLHQKGRLEVVLPQHWNEEITNSAPQDKVWILSLFSASKSWLNPDYLQCWRFLHWFQYVQTTSTLNYLTEVKQTYLKECWWSWQSLG